MCEFVRDHVPSESFTARRELRLQNHTTTRLPIGARQVHDQAPAFTTLIVVQHNLKSIIAKEVLLDVFRQCIQDVQDPLVKWLVVAKRFQVLTERHPKNSCGWFAYHGALDKADCDATGCSYHPLGFDFRQSDSPGRPRPCR